MTTLKSINDELEIVSAEIRIIQGVRLALSALRDVEGDIVDAAPGKFGYPAEHRTARLKSWNAIKALLASASDEIKFLSEGYRERDSRLSGLIDDCTLVLEGKERDRTEVKVRRLNAKLQARALSGEPVDI
jgi:hypothetical protein